MHNVFQTACAAYTSIAARSAPPSDAIINMDGFTAGTIVLPAAVGSTTSVKLFLIDHDGTAIDSGIAAFAAANNKAIAIPLDFPGVRKICWQAAGANLSGITVHLAS